MIRIGDPLPETELRTDEGTPLSLTDLKGRSISVFLLGDSFTPTTERLLKVMAENTGRFLSLDCSPVALLGEPVTELSAYRKLNDVPFLLVSDPQGVVHNTLRGQDGTDVGVWIVSEDSVVKDAVPILPPTELISVVLSRISRINQSNKQPVSDS